MVSTTGFGSVGQGSNPCKTTIICHNNKLLDFGNLYLRLLDKVCYEFESQIVVIACESSNYFIKDIDNSI